MVNLSKLTKAELQSTGFKNTSTARNFLKDILKTKAQKYKKDELINKLKSEYNKLISLLKNPKNSKSYIINNGILQDLLKLLKFIII